MSKRWLGLLLFIVWFGRGGLAEAAVTLTPEPLVIPDVAVGQASSATAMLGVDSGPGITVTLSLATGGACSQFQITSSTMLTLSVGNDKPVTVKLTPTSGGAKTCNLLVKQGPATVGTFVVNGTGLTLQISVDKATLTFGHVEVGGTSTAQTVTATNTGTAVLTISDASFFAGGTDYTATGVTGTTLNPGAATSWDISCAPSLRGTRNGTFRITSNATGAPTSDVALTCTGDQGALATNLATLAFGSVARGSTKTLPFTLSNPGNVTVTVTSAAITGGTGYTFDTTTLPATLAAGGSVALNATFAPTTATDGGTATLTVSGSWGAVPTLISTAMTLTGSNVGFDATPPTLDFGDFRFDTRPTLPYQILNSGLGDIVIQSATFTPDAGTATGDLGFVIKKGAAIVTLPQTLTAGQRLDVTVTAQPNNRTGAVGGHVDIVSNIAGSQRVTITGNATAAVVAPTTFDFGPVDIDGAAPSTMLMVTNTGTATVDITSIVKTGADAASFTVTLPTATIHLTAGTTLAIPVTYKPTTQRGPGAPEVAVLNATLAGVLDGPDHMIVTLTGRGIDRTLVVQASPIFPPTFRNPGDTAPIRAVTVHNNGEALLKISAVMLAGEPVWHVEDPSPIDIPGGASHDFLIRFSPTAIGPALAGKLTLINNDNANAMAMIPLTGTGVGRSVGFNPPTISLGYTGVGVPITVSNILAVTNLDPSTPFTIRSIDLSDAVRFHLEDAPVDAMLPAQGEKTYSLTFEPSTAGHFETTATLYLDQDPSVQATVTITGDAVFVAAHGSGGCDAGRGGGGLVLVTLVAALVALRRRRGRAPAVIAGLAALATTARVPVASADGVDATVFAPTPATSGNGFQLQSPEVGPNGSWVASAVASYAANPLVLDGYSAGTSVLHNALVERSSGLQLGAAFAFLGRFEAGAHLPIFLQSGASAPQDMNGRLTGLPVPPASGTARGNLVLHAKARLWSGSSVGAGAFTLGASAVGVVPTATKGQFTGSDKPEGRLLVLASLTPAALGSRLEISVNAGPIVRGQSTYANIAQKSGLAWGVGASLRLTDALWATTELYGEATPSGQRQAGTDAGMPAPDLLAPVEWLAGLSLQLDRRVHLGLAAGRGVTDAIGTPSRRGVFSLSIIAGTQATPPLHPPEPPKPDGDADGDGIPDSLDKCPNEPEDKDMFEDSDGCPDPDNDHDGIPDELDKCPLDPEDKDGFQDEDGCPDKDNDGDGIPDAQDKCPNEPEDKDGFEDLDGCPDPDNDHDGIPDAQDKCPNEPETINGFQDDDGCPDKGDSTIVLSPDRIETLDPITFTGAKLTRASLPLLEQVGATLRAHSEIVRVRITVHVQPTGDPDADQARSDKRAAAIRDWLVGWGVARPRLEVRGFGGEKPLMAPDKRGAARINDRVEFIILERK